jgi:hypothetical protein
MATTFDCIVQSLNQAVAYAKGKRLATKPCAPETVEVFAVRPGRGVMLVLLNVIKRARCGAADIALTLKMPVGARCISPDSSRQTVTS